MLAGWHDFFALAGAAAATLAGLLFVIITLGVNLPPKASELGAKAFLTPTLIHFCGVLLQALVALVPWPSDDPPGLLLGAAGLAGLAYTASVVRLMRKQDFVALAADSWIAYAGAPGLANLSLVAGGAGLIVRAPFAPYAVAGSTALLLFIGIRDAWDLTLWMVDHRDDAPPPEGGS